MTDILKAILKINPTAQVTVNADDINQITWHNGTTPISKADIEAQLPIVEFDMAMEDLRRKRNALLAKTDWTDLPNTPLSNEKKTEWQTYRQQLRDLTNGITTAEQAKAVVFPNEVQ